HHARDECPRARADVDVELVDGAVDREQVEGAKGAHLVDAPGETAAAEDERCFLAPPPAAHPPCAAWPSLGAVELDDLAHEGADYGIHWPRGQSAAATFADLGCLTQNR